MKKIPITKYVSLNLLKSTKSKIIKSKKARSKRNGFVFSLCGPHGVGKTTVYNYLKSLLEENSNIQFFPERLSTQPLFPFGSRDKQIAFRSELHYNQQMLMRNNKIRSFIENNRYAIAILDRSPICTIVYSKALALPDKDYQLIEDNFNSIEWVEEYLIYFDASQSIIMDRILKRGSLDQERLKWNEADTTHLGRVIKHYLSFFEEHDLKKKKHLDIIKTDNLTPHEVAEQIITIIERKTGIKLRNTIKIPFNQAKLTEWVDTKGE